MFEAIAGDAPVCRPSKARLRSRRRCGRSEGAPSVDRSDSTAGIAGGRRCCSGGHGPTDRDQPRKNVQGREWQRPQGLRGRRPALQPFLSVGTGVSFFHSPRSRRGVNAVPAARRFSRENNSKTLIFRQKRVGFDGGPIGMRGFRGTRPLLWTGVQVAAGDAEDGDAAHEEARGRGTGRSGRSECAPADGTGTDQDGPCCRQARPNGAHLGRPGDYRGRAAGTTADRPGDPNG